GLTRGRPGPAAALAEGEVALASREGATVLSLAPLVQAHRPLPSAEPELFFLEGGLHGGGARLVSLHLGFVAGDPALWERVAGALALDDPGAGAAVEPVEQAPYLGLAAFSASEAPLFVGRERDVETFLNRLRVQAFVGVVGPSGAGKSSFVA